MIKSGTHRPTDPPTHRPTDSPISLRRVAKELSLVVVCVGLIIGVLSCGAVARFGSIGTAFAFVRGDVLFVEPIANEITIIEAGGDVTLSYRLRNLSSVPLRLTGSEVSCQCVILSGFPRVVEPGGVTDIQANIRTSPNDRVTDGKIRIFTDWAEYDVLNLSYSITVPSSS